MICETQAAAAQGRLAGARPSSRRPRPARAIGSSSPMIQNRIYYHESVITAQQLGRRLGRLPQYRYLPGSTALGFEQTSGESSSPSNTLITNTVIGTARKRAPMPKTCSVTYSAIKTLQGSQKFVPLTWTHLQEGVKLQFRTVYLRIQEICLDGMYYQHHQDHLSMSGHGPPVAAPNNSPGTF